VTSINSHTLFQAEQDRSIWKLLCSTEGILVGEERHTQDRETSLFAYDLGRNTLLWCGLELDDKWWLSAIEITRDSLYVQHYAEGPLPTPAGVTSIDLLAGKVRWTQPRVAYYAESAGVVILLQQGMLQEQYLAVDLLTGEMTRRITTDELPPRNPDDFAHLTFPALIEPDETESGEIERMLRKLVDRAELRGSIEYHKRGDIAILSYYVRDTKDAQTMLENKLVQDLAIIDTLSNDILMHERLHRSANYPVSGSFFIFNDRLLYVKDGNELKSISLE
jgi:hypothetical protein